MIGRGFKSVGWVAAVGTAALGCYMLSLQVATERADLARVEREIISTKQQIRSLQTELGTRGRLTQLEQWNEDVLALAAPASGQFLRDEFTLARLETRDPLVADTQVRMAALEEERPASVPAPAIAQTDPPAQSIRPELVHRASFTPPPSRDEAATPGLPKARATKAAPGKPSPANAKATIATQGPAQRAPALSPAARPDPVRQEARRDERKSSSPRTSARSEIGRAEPVAKSPERSTTRRADRGSTVPTESIKPSRTAGERSVTERSAAALASGTTGRK